MVPYQTKAKQKPVKLKILLSCIILDKTYPLKPQFPKLLEHRNLRGPFQDYNSR